MNLFKSRAGIETYQYPKHIWTSLQQSGLSEEQRASVNAILQIILSQPAEFEITTEQIEKRTGLSRATAFRSITEARSVAGVSIVTTNSTHKISVVRSKA